MPDAAAYNDQGSNTLAHIAEVTNGLNLPNLQKLGLGNIAPLKGVDPAIEPLASYGKMKEISQGKDSTSGHWELMGLHSKIEFEYFPDGFPTALMDRFLQKTGCGGFLGNCTASGTEIINRLGEEHIKTGFPIVYTSADSVFQIAAHEEHFGLDRLYEICEITRNEVLKHNIVGRVIARPFIGEPGSFVRTTNRVDYSLEPTGDTLLDLLYENGLRTVGIGKIGDLFNYRSISEVIHTESNEDGCRQILKFMKKTKGCFILANLVDFDVYFGHRNDPEGFSKALKEFDDNLETIIDSMSKDDLLIITADHGNDPTTKSTDHSREYVPLLVYSEKLPSVNLGIRDSFSDAAKTVAEYFEIENSLSGKEFLSEIRSK